VALDVTESSIEKNIWSTKRSVSFAIISLIIGMIIFGFAYVGMRQNTGIGGLNQSILNWMISHRGAQTTSIMKLITDIANPIAFTIIVGAGAGLWVYIKREIWRPVILVGSVGFAAILSTALKMITTNNRPPITSMIAPFEMDYSFPSGHTIGIAVCLLVLGYLIYSRHSSAARVFNWSILTIISISLISISRLYLGYHWLTDVVASVGLGLMILTGAILVDIIISRRFEN
jgi:undecaprenyl-diphosphatase